MSQILKPFPFCHVFASKKVKRNALSAFALQDVGATLGVANVLKALPPHIQVLHYCTGLVVVVVVVVVVGRVPISCIAVVCQTIDPRLPTLPGLEHVRVFTDQAQISRVHQARSAVRCSASRINGELHAAKNRLCVADFRTLCVPPCVSTTMTQLRNNLFVFWCDHFQDIAMDQGYRRMRYPLFTCRR